MIRATSSELLILTPAGAAEPDDEIQGSQFISAASYYVWDCHINAYIISEEKLVET